MGRDDLQTGPFAQPIHVDDVSQCLFYHAMDVPGHGFIWGPWDLRSKLDAYLGNFDFRAKRVLELGTTDGYLTFAMEARGAEVISQDLSESDQWDVVPYARIRRGSDTGESAGPSWLTDAATSHQATMRRMNNAYWFCHRRFDSRARLVLSDIYSVPPAIGAVDVTLFGAILLHTHDPFLALARNLQLTRESVIITDALGYFRLPAPLRWLRGRLPRQLRRPIMRFYPDWQTGEGADGWWRLTPEIVQMFIGVLGFERSEVSVHDQLYKGRHKRLFTVVGHRTAPAPDPDLLRYPS